MGRSRAYPRLTRAARAVLYQVDRTIIRLPSADLTSFWSSTIRAVHTFLKLYLHLQVMPCVLLKPLSIISRDHY